MKNFIKLLFFVVCIFYSNHFYSQIATGVAEYTASFDLSALEKRISSGDYVDEEEKQKMERAIQANKELKFMLIFSEDESNFYCISDLNAESNKNGQLNATQLYADAKGFYYSNKEENIRINSNFENLQIIQDPIKWTLTNETKQIGKYHCFKATSVRIVEGRNGIMERPIVAWYTKGIPTSFGPQNMNDLEGLIVELQINNRLFFRLSDIVLNPEKNLEIKKPTGKKITTSDFTKKLKGTN